MGAQAVVATAVDGVVSTSVVPVGSAGTKDGAAALSGDELFPVYSITKTLIATAVMLLVEQGRLDLDEPVPMRLPQLPLDEPVTVLQLLRHTGGLPDYGGLPEYARDLSEHPDRPWSREDFLGRALARGLLFAPGTSWAYSNVGYLCLAMLLEHEHGGPLAEVLGAELFDRVGLVHARVATSLDDMAALTPAASARLSPDGTPVQVPARYHPGWVSHGLVLSTAPELARLVDAIFTGRVVAPETLALMTAEPVLVPIEHPLFAKPGYGSGLMVDAGAPGLVAGHGGGGPGYSAGVLHVRSADASGVCPTAVALANTETDDVGLTLALQAARAVDGGPVEDGHRH